MKIKDVVMEDSMDEGVIVDATNGRLMENTQWDPKKLANDLERVPLGDHVIIRRRLYSNVTDSGLIRNVSDVDKEVAATQGMVAAIGPDVVNIDVGDEVVFQDYQGRPIKGSDGKPYYLVRMEFVQAIVAHYKPMISKAEQRIKEFRASRAKF
jgi:co-chaperonin GroES (HSP10)